VAKLTQGDKMIVGGVAALPAIAGGAFLVLAVVSQVPAYIDLLFAGICFFTAWAVGLLTAGLLRRKKAG
jgi:hypothetical protein